MLENARKKWTLLFYANGNNELEPEMRQAMAEIENAEEAPNTHVVLQIGRESYELIKILREGTQPPKPHETWEGVRRYTLRDNQMVLLNDLGKANMAHPATLQDFLDWGFANFPAEKYMLIVGGHSWQFLGTMTDYSQQEPYIMGIPGIAEAINTASNRAGLQLDLVLFDTCNFNVIEVVYELGTDPRHAVKNMATYIGNGPLQGLSCQAIIQQADRFAYLDDTKAFINNFIRGLGHSLVACEVCHSQLSCIKELYHKLAVEYSSLFGDAINIQQLLNGNSLDPWYGNLIDLKEHLIKIIILATNRIKGQGIINIASQRTADIEIIKLYSMLSFAKDNYWTHLLSEKPISEIEPALQSRVPFQPLRLSEREVCRYLSLINPGFSPERIRETFLGLAAYKNWKVN